ncbi:hypothetical protein KFE25_004884 [Diacronema lutheri]|uniref:Uncharacterized protein n=2 Tax=Diacronema lutheri TaxID=2081491 RepID=A0A8J6CDB7_DIALT|nr:hypothetical protein KFE25_004884 [Diacronema lutheri]
MRRSTWRLRALVAALVALAARGAAARSEHGVAGLDLGAENSVVAIARRGGVDVVANEQARRHTPSALAFGARRRLFGDAALSQLGSNSAGTVRAPICLVAALADRPLAVRVDHAGDAASVGRFALGRRRADLTPLQLVGAQAAHLHRLAAADHGARVPECCVAVPVGTTARGRRVLAAAAMLDCELADRRAGLGDAQRCERIRLVRADTAALVALALARTPHARASAAPGGAPAAGTAVAIVDVGHTGVRVCIARVSDGACSVLARAHADGIGGRAFTRALVRAVAARWRAELGVDALANRRSAERLRAAAARAKHALSAPGCIDADVRVDRLTPELDGVATITPADLEASSAHALAALDALCARALVASGLRAVEAVELIGGGSRMPAVAARARAAFGGEPVRLRRSLNDKEAIARGAALAGAAASSSFKVRPLALADLLCGSALRVRWVDAPYGTADTIALDAGASLPAAVSAALPAGAAASLVERGILRLRVVRAEARGAPCLEGAHTPERLTELADAADDAARDSDAVSAVLHAAGAPTVRVRLGAASTPRAAGSGGAEGAVGDEAALEDEMVMEDEEIYVEARLPSGGNELGRAADDGRVTVTLAVDLCGDIVVTDVTLSWVEDGVGPQALGDGASASASASALDGARAVAGGDLQGATRARGDGVCPATDTAGATASDAAPGLPRTAGANRSVGEQPMHPSPAPTLPVDGAAGAAPGGAPEGALGTDGQSATTPPPPPPSARPAPVERRVSLLLGVQTSSVDLPAHAIAAARDAESTMARVDATEEHAQEAHNELEGSLLSAAAELREAEGSDGAEARADAALACTAEQRALREWLADAEAWLEQTAAAQRTGALAEACGEAHTAACEDRLGALRALRAAAFPPREREAQPQLQPQGTEQAAGPPSVDPSGAPPDALSE